MNTSNIYSVFNEFFEQSNREVFLQHFLGDATFISTKKIISNVLKDIFRHNITVIYFIFICVGIFTLLYNVYTLLNEV